MISLAYGRKTKLSLIYNNQDISAYLEPYLIGFSYTDNSGAKADDLQITLEDRASLWKGDWLPEKGATLQAAILVFDWDRQGTTQALPLGLFEIDEIECSGPPEVVNIKAVSVPVASSLRGEDKSRAWEETRLLVIAKDIADAAGLTLLYETDDNPSYDRIEQTEESDLSFLLKLCEDAGLSLKVTGEKIIIFDDIKYEQMEPVMTIVKGASAVLSYSVISSTRDVYSAAKVMYQSNQYLDPIVYTFEAPDKPKGKTLIINERVSSIAEAERLAKKRLRQKNKEEIRFSLSMVGNITLVCGVTVMLQGWGAFDGKYFVEQATHEGGSGYTTKLELYRVLEGY